MSVARSLRSSLPLLLGLVIGGAGAILFQESMPGTTGSAEERANKMELELKKARARIAALETASDKPGRKGTRWFGSLSAGGPERTLADNARSIAEDIREGKPVSPNDIFRATKPLLRDLAPLFDRIRVREQQNMIDSMTGELARKYDLTPQSQALLDQWFQEKAKQEGQRWSELLAHDSTGIEDMMRASRDVRPDEGLDSFMETLLSGDKLAAFKSERIAQRAERVQQEADRRVQRLDTIVGLDESQRDHIFGVIARSSRDYDPAMRLEGAHGEIGATPTASREEAILAILTPQQRAAYDAQRQQRREEAAKDLEAIGLTLPADWEMLDESDFK